MELILYRLLVLLSKVAYAYSIVLIVYALMSWFPGASRSKLGQLVAKISEPYLRIFRRLPLQFAGIDFSFLVALIVYQYGSQIIINLLVKILVRAFG